MSLRDAWTIDPDVTFLNHGSFGATPRAILERQAEIRAEMERQPLTFFARNLMPRLDTARERAAEWVGADPAGFAFVANATAGVNTVLRSLRFEPGDELLVTDHEYNASKNALEFAAERDGARIVRVHLPVPTTPDDVLERIVAATTDATRPLLFDHITSQTGMILPIAAICEAMNARGIETLVDGAHGPGMLELNLDALGATYYTGNFHKWGCAPKSVAFLWVTPDRRHDIRPLAISHGASTPDLDARFQAEFEWTGTFDPTPALLVPETIAYLEGLVDGGWPAIYARNRQLALHAREVLHPALDTQPICPDDMIGTLATFRLPDGDPDQPPAPLVIDPWQDTLLERFGIEVPIISWPKPPHRVLRISAHLYNEPADYDRLANALTTLVSENR
jgi:isopenicillin-N epimerase